MNPTQKIVAYTETIKLLGAALVLAGFIPASEQAAFVQNASAGVGAILYFAPLVFQFWNTTMPRLLARIAALKSTTGAPLVTKVELNPLAPEAPSINAATPSNVVVPSTGVKP